MLEQADGTGHEDDARYRSIKRGDELGEEMMMRESRLRNIREAKEALEREAPAAAPTSSKDRPRPGRPPQAPPGGPKQKAQRNFTDQESRIMVGRTAMSRYSDRLLAVVRERAATAPVALGVAPVTSADFDCLSRVGSRSRAGGVAVVAGVCCPW